MPFKIDLRHVALWVENKNPYQETLNEECFKINWSKNLESFLIGHIFSHSNLQDFNTRDRIAACPWPVKMLKKLVNKQAGLYICGR